MIASLRKLYTCGVIGVLLLCSAPVMAAADDDGDYNPDFPAEPSTITVISLKCEPEGAAHLSGAGHYSPNTNVSINASAVNTCYTFQYWTVDGEQYSTESHFNYITTQDVTRITFVAHFSYTEPTPEPDEPFNPSFPDDPVPMDPIHPVISNPLYLVCTPSGCCSFNRTSGVKANADDAVFIEAYPNQDFVFNGWYHNGSIISRDLAFYYSMGNQATTLTASFTYSPTFPSEPGESNQQDVDTGDKGILGDVNRDGVINVQDAVLLTKLYLNGDPDSQLTISLCDMNADGTVNVADAVAIVSYYLTHK